MRANFGPGLPVNLLRHGRKILCFQAWIATRWGVSCLPPPFVAFFLGFGDVNDTRGDLLPLYSDTSWFFGGIFLLVPCLAVIAVAGELPKSSCFLPSLFRRPAWYETTRFLSRFFKFQEFGISVLLVLRVLFQCSGLQALTIGQRQKGGLSSKSVFFSTLGYTTVRWRPRRRVFLRKNPLRPSLDSDHSAVAYKPSLSDVAMLFEGTVPLAATAFSYTVEGYLVLFTTIVRCCPA